MINLGAYKKSIRVQKSIFDYQFLPSAPIAAAWIGFKDTETNYTQFYVVESIIGGEAGALERLGYFGDQYSEFFNKRGGQIKLIVLGNDPMDLVVVTKLYPKLVEKLIYVSVAEPISGTSKMLIGREEIVE